MKKLLGILSALVITAITSTSVVACSNQPMTTWAIPNNLKKNSSVRLLNEVYDAKNSTVILECNEQLDVRKMPTPEDFVLVEFDSQTKVEGFKITSDEINNQNVYRSDSNLFIELSETNKALLKDGQKYQMNVKGIIPSDDPSNNWFEYDTSTD